MRKLMASLMCALLLLLVFGANSVRGQEAEAANLTRWEPDPAWADTIWSQAAQILHPFMRSGTRMHVDGEEFFEIPNITKRYYMPGFAYGVSDVPPELKIALTEIGATLTSDLVVYVIGVHDGGRWSGGANHNAEHNAALDGNRAKKAAPFLRDGNPEAIVLPLAEGVEVPRTYREDDVRKRGVLVVVVRRDLIPADTCLAERVGQLEGRVSALENAPKKDDDSCKASGRNFTFGPLVGWEWIHAGGDSTGRWYNAPTFGLHFTSGRVGMWASFGWAPRNINSEYDQVSEAGFWWKFHPPIYLWGAGVDARTQAGQQLGWGEYYTHRASGAVGGLGIETGRILRIFTLNVRGGIGYFDSERRLPTLYREQGVGYNIRALIQAHL